MAKFNGRDFGREIVGLVRGHLEKAFAPVSERLNAIERRLDEDRKAASVTNAVIDRDGCLSLILSDGKAIDVGRVVGRDAEPAQPGVDGLGFEDMTEELDADGRTIIRRYSRGDQVKEFRHTMAVVLDRGVYKAEQTYQPGDGVTFGGSYWIAQAETDQRPDAGGGAWRLAVKKGRDARSAS